MRFVVAITLICSIALISIAQGDRRGPVQSPSGINLNSAEIEGREELVKNQPYTATAFIETTQILADGNRISRKVEQIMARDSQGRTRHEQLLDRIGSLAGDAPKLIFISDPVTGKEYTLNTKDKTVSVQKRIDIEALMRSAQERPERTRPAREKSAGIPPVAQSRRQIKREDLGEKVLEGLTVKGERLSATLAAGSVGNERPLELSLETWYSGKSRLFLYRKRVDPRFGEIVFVLTNIQRHEPDGALFQIPRGYKYIRTSFQRTR